MTNRYPEFLIALNRNEIDLIVEALQARASRHDSIALANPRNAGPHERTSIAMRKLARKLRLEIGDVVPA